MKFLEIEKRLGKSFCSIEPATAILAGSALSAGGSIFSGVFGSSASKQQAAAIRDAAEIASRTALQLDDRARADVAPFRSLGVDAGDIVGKILRGEVNLDEALGQSSIFKWQQSEGERSLNRQLSARGLYGSGAGLETLARFNNQLVAEEGTRYWDRLFNTTTLGANAAARMATNTSNTGRSLLDLTQKTAPATGAAVGDAGRSIASIGPGVANSFASGITNWMQYELYKPILDRLGQEGNGLANGARAIDFDYSAFS